MAVGSGGGSGGRAGQIRAGQAFVELAAKDIGLKTGLDRARRLVLGFAKVATGLAVVGIGATMAATAESFREVIKHFDELNKASDRTGATVEALSALEYAAKQSDATLEDVANGAKFLQRTLSEAAAGGKEAQDSLAKLGLTAEDLKGKGLEEQFDLIAEGLAAIPDPADRTAAALAVLGRGGLALVPMLKDGAAGLRELRKEAGDIGAIVTTEQAQRATRIGDALSKGLTALKYAFLSLGAALLPFVDDIEAIVNGFVLLVKAAREYVPVGIESLRNWLDMATAGSAFGAALKFIGDTFGTVWQGIKDAIAGGDIKLAFEVAGAGIEVAWAQMLVNLTNGWNKFKASFVDGWHDVVTQLKKLWVDFAMFLEIGVLEANRRAFDALGMGERADKFANMIPEVMRGAELDKRKIDLDARRDQATREAARNLDAMGAAAALAAAELNLETKTREASIAKWSRISGNIAIGAIVGMGRAWQAGVRDSLFAATRGQFGGRNLGAALGIGSEPIEKKQLDQLERIGDGVDEMKGKVGGLKGV